MDRFRKVDRLLPLFLRGGQLRPEGFKVFLCVRQFFLERAKFGLLLGRRSFDHRRGVAVLDRLPLLRTVVEESEELTELLVSDRVVFVVVTASATDRQPEPNGRGRVDAIDDVLDGILFRDDPAFRVAPVVAIESGGDRLSERGARQHVAGDLFYRELIEAHVPVEGVDYPVAPTPHVSLAVTLIAIRVCVPGGIQPRRGHPLPIARGGKKPVDDLFVGGGRSVRKKGIDFRRSWGKTGQIQCDAPDERCRLRFGRRGETFAFETLENEAIDRVSRPGGVPGLWQRRACRRNEGPVLLPFRALFDPPPYQLDLSLRQLASRAPRRHALALFCCGDAAEHLASGGIARHNCMAASQVYKHSLPGIESKAGHPLRFVGLAATKTVI